ncbi:MAG: NAD(P)-dependent oxidoreductase [Hyphomicrobiaceae bacterium]|nr:NAD(P)-dependent oxidoreductase [Hyphomicrobiaceae bacterium]
MRIGFIGLGVMGGAMAAHLAKGGHNLALYDIAPAAARKISRRHKGARTADSPREVAEASEVVFTMLPEGNAVRACVFDPDGLAAGFKRGSILVDTSSAEPWLTRETAVRLVEHGVAMIDAPVSGAAEGARNASLVFMCGGEAAALKRVRPLLALMGKHVFHLGPVGSGHAMKTVNNLATALTLLGTTEAMLIGKAYGIAPSAMLDVLNVSTGRSFVTDVKFGPQVVERRFDDAFRLALMLKDVGIANRLADDQGLGVPVSALGEQLWRAANAALGEGACVLDVVRWYERATGVELKD